MLTEFWIEAASFLVRWLHVVAAIAWIGESFYFVALDRGLKPASEKIQGLYGESWSVHGGGFYLKQKYLPAPAQLPSDLHWSMWKSYTTWLSGFALLCFLYLLKPSFFLIDPAIAEWTGPQAIAMVMLYLFGGYVVYDLLCHLFGNNDRVLGLAVSLFVIVMVWLVCHTFAGRAAYLISGAVLATIMSANVFFVIIPGQRRMVAALQQGIAPNPLDGARGKQRSVHNTYFTLPVVFAMLSTHYAAMYVHAHGWILLLMMMAAAAMIREFFVRWHSGARTWWLLIVAASMIAMVFCWIAPKSTEENVAVEALENSAATTTQSHAPTIYASMAESDGKYGEMQKPTTRDIQPIVQLRCNGCHSAKPSLLGAAPKGAIFDEATQLEMHADKILLQVVQSRIMPPGNLTAMTETERAVLQRWHVNLKLKAKEQK